MTLARMKVFGAFAIALGLFSGPDSFHTVRAEEPSAAYQFVANPLKFPEGRGVGFIMGLDVDRNGKDIWVLDTCGGDLGACVTSKTDPILKFDASGKLLKSFGSGMLAQPHGLYVDRSGDIWIVDGFGANNSPSNKGHAVFKFSADGKLLMTLGTPGVKGETETTFNWPSDVLVAPNDDIFVADGHADGSNARIVKFNKKGKFLKAWGKSGTGPSEFSETHSLAMDSRGRLFVADRRNNNRIQIFDQEGRFLEEWKQFGSPAELFIDRKDVLYVADALSGFPGMKTGRDKPGIIIGSAKDGKVIAFVPDVPPNCLQELVVPDAAGNLWGGCTTGRAVRKWVKK
jgi:hypothetical protein